MPNDLEKARAFSSERARLAAEMDALRDEMDLTLTYKHSDGVFKVDRTLLCFTRMLVDDGKGDVVMQDMRGNPIRIDDIKAFHDRIYSLYFETMNHFRVRYSSLRERWEDSNIFEFVE